MPHSGPQLHSPTLVIREEAAYNICLGGRRWFGRACPPEPRVFCAAEDLSGGSIKEFEDGYGGNTPIYHRQRCYFWLSVG